MKKVIINIAITLLVIAAVLGGVALYAMNYYKKGIQAVSEESEEVEVVIENGQSAYSILMTLNKAGLVKDLTCGKVYLKLNDVGNLQANPYVLNKNMSLEELFYAIANPTDENVLKRKVTILDGYSIPQISEKIAEAFGITADDVMDLLNDPEFLNTLIEEYWFITEEILQEGIKYPLEGYLYPDTIVFNQNVSLEDVIRGSLDMMDAYLTTAKPFLEAREWTPHQFLTFASIVERESLFDEDRPKIAGVFINRLEDDMLLQSDITVNYAWERTGVDVTYDHLEIDSPYNTYMYKGLPIGPISSVSEVTMNSCVNYEDNDYLFFFAKEDGTVLYSSTLAEHNAIVDANKWY